MFKLLALALAAVTGSVSVPGNGDVVNQSPASVTVTFDEPVDAATSTATLVGDPFALSLGVGTAAGETSVVFEVNRELPDGMWQLRWEAFTDAGEGTGGEATFEVRAGNTVAAPVNATVPASPVENEPTAAEAAPVGELIALGLIPLAALVGFFIWYQFFRGRQSRWIPGGSVSNRMSAVLDDGTEDDRGLPLPPRKTDHTP